MEKILIVEDIAETGQWFIHMVEKVFPNAEVKLCNSFQSAQREILLFKPALALVDVSLPDGNGLELIQPILKRSNDCAIVITTIVDDQNSIFRALQLGATGYLLKDLSEQIFLNKLQGILNGEPPLSPAVARKILQSFLKDRSVEVTASSWSNISDREVEILSLIARGLSKKEIAKLLVISQNTVATHVKNVYQKLNINNRAEAVSKAYRLGLLKYG